MNDRTRLIRRPWRAGLRIEPRAAILAVLFLGLLVAACAGSPSSTRSTNSPSANSRALAFSICMRNHGVPNYPDPDSSGATPKETAGQLGVSPSTFQAAQGACAHLLPNSDTGGMTEAQKEHALNSYRNFTGCMRSHGVGNWPEPAEDSAGRPIFEIQGIDPDIPQISMKINECKHLLTQASTQGPGQGVVGVGVGWPFMCSATGSEPWSDGPCSRD